MKPARKTMAIASIVAVAGLSMSACSKGDATADAAGSTQATGAGAFCQGKNLRFEAGGTPGDGFTDIIIKGANAAAAATGAKVDVVTAKWDSSTMVSQFRDAAAAKPDGIAMMGHAGPDALAPIAQQANGAGVPVEWLNVDVPTIRASNGGGFVGSDLAAQGTALAKKAVETVGLQSGDKAIIFGSFDNATRGVREFSTAAALESAGIKVVRVTVPVSASSNPSELTPVLTATVQKNPDVKMLVYGGGGLMSTVPQYMAAVNKKPGELANVGFDLNAGIVKAIQSGYIQVTADQQPYLQGYLPVISLCMTTVYNMSPLDFNTGAGFVTKDNVESVVKLVEQGIR